MSDPPPSGAARGRVRAALRGAALLAGAAVLTQAANYALHLGLARLFPPALYGRLGLLVAVLALLEVVLRWGISRAVGFLVARDRVRAGAVVRTALALQAGVAVACLGGVLALAPALAGWLGDPELAPGLRWCALFAVTFAGVPVAAGLFNGWGAFDRQAVVGVLGPLARLGLVLGALALGLGLDGVLFAYVVSPLAAIAYALRAAPPLAPGPAARVPVRVLLALGLPFFASQVALAVLLRLDLFLVQSLLRDPALTGLYAAAWTLVKAPYAVTQGSGLVLFRTVAELHGTAGAPLRALVTRTVRYCAATLAPAALVLAAAAEALMGAVFGDAYRAAGPALAVLSLCLPCLVLHTVLGNCLAGLGRLGTLTTLSVALVPVEALLVRAWIGLGLVGAALAATTTWALGALVAGLALARAGALARPRWSTVAAILAAALLAGGVVAWAAPAGPGLLVVCPLAYLLGLGLLVGTGTLARRDLAAVRAPRVPGRDEREA